MCIRGGGAVGWARGACGGLFMARTFPNPNALVAAAGGDIIPAGAEAAVFHLRTVCVWVGALRGSAAPHVQKKWGQKGAHGGPRSRGLPAWPCIQRLGCARAQPQHEDGADGPIQEKVVSERRGEDVPVPVFSQMQAVPSKLAVARKRPSRDQDTVRTAGAQGANGSCVMV